MICSSNLIQKKLSAEVYVLFFYLLKCCCWKFVLKLFYAILCDFEKNGIKKRILEKKNTLVFEI